MKQSIVKDLTTDELREKISEESGNLLRMKMSQAVSPIENPMKIRSTRKLVARLQTESRKRELANQTK